MKYQHVCAYWGRCFDSVRAEYAFNPKDVKLHGKQTSSLGSVDKEPETEIKQRINRLTQIFANKVLYISKLRWDIVGAIATSYNPFPEPFSHKRLGKKVCIGPLHKHYQFISLRLRCLIAESAEIWFQLSFEGIKSKQVSRIWTQAHTYRNSDHPFPVLYIALDIYLTLWETYSFSNLPFHLNLYLSHPHVFYLFSYSFKKKMQATVSKLPDKGDRILKQIAALQLELDNIRMAKRTEKEVVDVDEITEGFHRVLNV